MTPKLEQILVWGRIIDAHSEKALTQLTHNAMETDINFLQSIFKRFVPAVVCSKGDGKLSKKPLFTGWLDITPEESEELAKHVNYKHGPFFFLTGSTTSYITVDIDRRNPKRSDHAKKIDGLAYWDRKFPESEHMNTLIIRTPTGGYHLVYKYQEGITSGELESDVLIDILSDGKGMCFAPGFYEIVNRVKPSTPPARLVQIIQNNISIGTVNIGTSSNVRDYAYELNKIIGCDVLWHVSHSSDSKPYIAVPSTNLCLVDNEHKHSEDNHSCLIVSKTRVVARCYSHGEAAVAGPLSKQLRALFYPKSTEFHDFMSELIDFSVGKGLYRSDGYVFKVDDYRPWIYERVSTYEDFINNNFAGTPVFMHNPRKFKDVMLYMGAIDHPRFMFLKRDRDYIGFRNCALNISTFETEQGSVVPRHYIDADFLWDRLETPLFDSLISSQLSDPGIRGYFMAFIGRSLFRVKDYDNYGIVPFVKGDTQTGKSTVIGVLEAMFLPSTVGVITSNNEVTFGLESKHNKEILIAHEIDIRFTERLSSDLFKQMCCGEAISVPRKSKQAIDVKWDVPMFLFSNIHLPYRDVQGSISRRLAIFKFENYVENKKMDLETNIVAHELPALIGRCLLAYKQMVENTGNLSFWDVCPDYFRDNIDEMKEETDYLYMYLTLPPNDNVYNHQSVHFMKKEGSYMLLQTFKEMFTNYMRFKHKGVDYKWTSDYYAFKRLGYEIERVNVCKGCNMLATHNCCSDYNKANRSRRYIVRHLLCVTTPLYEGVS